MSRGSDNHLVVSEFGATKAGQAVRLYTMTNEHGLEVKITNYGGIITSIKTPGKDNTFKNVVLGFDKLDDYLQDHPFFGAIIGRYANRIAKGTYTSNAIQHNLTVNEGENHLHGGNIGFDKMVWGSEITGKNQLTLTYLSPDGEEGYPGNLWVTVIYSLTPENELKIEYKAHTDKITPVNLTNHSYFNLSGHHPNKILDHELTLFADYYTPVNDQQIPTGDIEKVSQTPFDFNSPRVIGKYIQQITGGYDHNYVLRNKDAQVNPSAILYHSDSGRKMKVYTDKPGLQLYTGNNLDGTVKDATGTAFEQHAGLCLESQYYPDSPNIPEFPDPFLRKGQEYKSTTIYQFLVE
ncbi:MAG: aldose epimerase family protein [Balneolales bacterium]